MPAYGAEDQRRMVPGINDMALVLPRSIESMRAAAAEDPLLDAWV